VAHFLVRAALRDEIEDLMLPFFCVTTNLTRATSVARRSGLNLFRECGIGPSGGQSQGEPQSSRHF